MSTKSLVRQIQSANRKLRWAKRHRRRDLVAQALRELALLRAYLCEGAA